MQRKFDAILSGLLDEEPSLKGRPVLLAVSGGIDSMCMAELFLHSLSFVRFAVAHCNFRLRGDESDSDELLVTEWCARNGIRLYKKDFDTVSYARTCGISIEMAARDLRYGWFAETARAGGFGAVAVAHNANDNVETLMLNLLRGTGIRGISGMHRLSGMPGYDGGFLIRPLLGFTRKQIEGFARSRGISWHEDRTNAGTEYKRNRIRNLVFPVFEDINPSFVRTIAREMDYFSQVSDIADDYFQTCRDGILIMGKAGDVPGSREVCRIDIGRLKACRHWEYILYRLLEPYGFNSASVQSVCRILTESDTAGGKSVSAAGYELVTSSTYLAVRPLAHEEGNDLLKTTLTHRRPVRHETLAQAYPVMTVRGPGRYSFNGVSFTVEERQHDAQLPVRLPAGTIMFDRERMDFPFLCRGWMSGDWMRPLGLKGRKKISDLFTDLKYGRSEKESAVMIVSPPAPGAGTGDVPEHHVMAVLGVRIDDAVKVTSSTDKVIVIRVAD